MITWTANKAAMNGGMSYLIRGGLFVVRSIASVTTAPTVPGLEFDLNIRPAHYTLKGDN